ncbi:MULTISPECIES: iron ABC transporter permease [unclassified Exiguobacterium]|uniref:FecCD family ABC transporter permease n=1 Tax=unclassified Exiguobacterium TaxID=2644629 RepID=UPI001BE8413E|nr:MULTISPECIES: iron ABC transporter permease [unclassified Exiguobacterium]
MDMWSALQKSRFTFLSLCVLLIVTFLYSLSTGILPVSFSSISRTIIGQGTDAERLVLIDLRLPRMLLALLIGSGLAVSGTLLQGMSRNALADPGILGINAGAGLFVVMTLFYFRSALHQLPLLPFVAFFGAILVAWTIYRLAGATSLQPARLLLVGVGINALCGALLIIFQLKMDPRDFQQATVWLTGSIWQADWSSVFMLTPWIVLFIPLAFMQSRSLNLLQLSGSLPQTLGLQVERTRKRILFVAAALAGACVAAGGGISFIGLLAPHIARRLVGPNHYSLIPVAALVGSLLVLLADLIGKNLLAPADIPVGIVIAVLGAPYFIVLLFRK